MSLLRWIKASIILSVFTLNYAWSAAVCPDSITMGWEPWRPYQYINEQGNLTGLDIELVAEYVKTMGCEAKFVNIPWARHLKEVEAGNIYLAGAASKTTEREVYANFSDSYRHEIMALFVKAEYVNKFQMKTLADLKNTQFQLGITRGYFYGNEFDGMLKDASFKARVSDVEGIDINIKKLLSDRVDGFMEDQVAIVDTLKQQQLDKKIVKHPMVVNENEVFIMVSKKLSTPEFMAALNKAIADVKSSGKFQEILDKYTK